VRTRIIIIHVVIETEKREPKNPLPLELEVDDNAGLEPTLLLPVD